ncbi:MAG TPA: class I SAM-dependent methyltransferase [Polyangiaceae bacterium]|jgi:SAM-dependent methyltransferase|nr:class I SAM-dependent methyltransferase [Polyangiaceae bacterium]
MKPEDLFALVQRLNGPMEALGALAAELRVQTEGLSPDPRVQRALDDVLSALGLDLDALSTLPDDAKVAAAGGISAFLRQAADVVDNPTRAPGWAFTEPEFLQNQGRMSMPIAHVVAAIAPSLGDLAARLDGGKATFLDIGTGVGWLAIAMATRFPGLSVVGIDVHETAIDVGRENVAKAALADRVVLRRQDVLALTDRDAFDLAFVAAPFLEQSIVPAALERTRDALNPGGVLLFGTFATIDEPLATATQALRIVRSGGHPWTLDEARDLVERAGLVDAHVIGRTWKAPIALVAGRKA